MYTIQEIGQLLGAEVIITSGSPPTGEHLIAHLAFDSRRVSFPIKTLFFAIKGARQDGHDYLDAAHQEGVRHFVVQEEVKAERFPGSVFLRVGNTVAALQALARHHRHKFSYPVIGITGSNGKTWVKEWLFQLIRQDIPTIRSPRSYNSQIGVPLAVWQMQETHQLGIFEAGISQPGEMANLKNMISPDIGVFTVLGDAHDDGFRDRREKLAEKALLFSGVHTLLYHGDQPEVRTFFEKTFAGKTLRYWSAEDPDADLFLRNIEDTDEGRYLTYVYCGTEHHCYLPFRDTASLHNLMTCCLVMHYLEIPAERFLQRISELQPIDMRLEILEAGDGCLLINDSYSFDLHSLQLAMEIQNQYARGRDKTVILSDLAGTGGHSVYPQIENLIREHKPKRLIGIGPRIGSMLQGLDTSIEFTHFPDTQSCIAALPEMRFHNEVILLKGAREFGFERIVAHLQARMHNAVLEIDFNAMLHNLQAFAGRLRPGVKLMVMVKANAYGSGSAEVARFLELQHVDAFSVAYPDEGIELREVGIQAPVVVLNPEQGALEKFFIHRLEPEVYSVELLRQFDRLARERDETLRIHLKIDTGMHRLGFQPEDSGKLLEALGELGPIHIASVFTHLSAAGAAEHDAFTHAQVRTFLDVYTAISDTLGYTPARHVLNSSGILRFPEYHFEMVRLGIGLYGVGLGQAAELLQPVHTLRARISQVTALTPGESVGYNRAFTATRPTVVATVNVGYADGLMRLAGDGRYSVNLGGRQVPIIGNICMDMCMLDVTDIEGVRPGDSVTIFGPGQPIDRLAGVCSTISYEILSRMSPRIARIYHMT